MAKPAFVGGENVRWYPGDSDYPSNVRIIKPVEEAPGKWWVTYSSNRFDSPPWIVKETELVKGGK